MIDCSLRQMKSETAKTRALARVGFVLYYHHKFLFASGDAGAKVLLPNRQRQERCFSLNPYTER
jgi:hypothetical protein